LASRNAWLTVNNLIRQKLVSQRMDIHENMSPSSAIRRAKILRQLTVLAVLSIDVDIVIFTSTVASCYASNFNLKYLFSASRFYNLFGDR
jgi:hypothetical protein